MQISYRKSFKKAFEKLSQNIKKQAIERIDLFTNNPTHPILNNHKLQGTYLGFAQSISLETIERFFVNSEILAMSS